jgi:flagellin-like hook-associated protein FlgL
MSMMTISSLGTEMQSITSLNGEANELSTLTEQLSSGQQSDDLAGYSPDDQNQIYDLTGSIDQLNTYQTVGNLISPTTKVYDKTLTDISSIVNPVQQILSQDSSSTSATNSTAANASQLQSYMLEIENDLNQQSNGSYIFSGSRSVAPVGDLTSLLSASAPSQTAATANGTLPIYDSESGGTDTTTNTDAYDTPSAQIDTGYTLNYGISSDDPAFQNTILAISYAYAATQNPANSTSYMASAQSLLNSASTGVQQLQAQNAANSQSLSSVNTNQSTLVNDLESQLGDIQNINTTTVSTQISYLQTQLEASYSATALLTKLSLSQYL